MKKFNFIFITTVIILFLSACQTVSKKIDDKTSKEEAELSKWLNQAESDLKIEFGNPDKIEFTNSRTRYYIYISEKIKIKCERKFEINSNNQVIGFSSKNCF
tara:strand:+ start:165 stop:470 length:306 start_codon:yes stop_codon:yes gene_type:complete